MAKGIAKIYAPREAFLCKELQAHGQPLFASRAELGKVISTNQLFDDQPSFSSLEQRIRRFVIGESDDDATRIAIEKSIENKYRSNPEFVRQTLRQFKILLSGNEQTISHLGQSARILNPEELFLLQQEWKMLAEQITAHAKIGEYLQNRQENVANALRAAGIDPA